MKKENPIIKSGTLAGLYDFSERNKNYKLLFSALILTILVLFTYRDAFDNNFVDFDDFNYVVNNNLVRDNQGTTLGDVFRIPVSSNWHPLTILSMRLNNNECRDCTNGISPAPFIRTNIIIHVFNTILVLILVYLLGNGSIVVAMISAAIFGVHPMHVESVAWISERKDVLYSFFFLSGLIAFLNFKRGNRKNFWLGLSFLLFLLSCLSKATAVIFPLVILLLNYWFSDPGESKTLRGFLKKIFPAGSAYYLVPFFIVSLFTGLLAYSLQSGENFGGFLELKDSGRDVVNMVGSETIWQKLATGCFGFIAYIIKFIAPVGLSAFYPYPGTMEYESSLVSTLQSASPVAVILLLILVLISLKKTRLFFFGTGFFLLTVILVLQVLPVGRAMMADRYTYLPYIGLSFIAASLVSAYGAKYKLIYIVAGCYLTVMIFLAGRQANVWENTETLWTNTLKNYPGVEIALRSRGKYYSKAAILEKNANQRAKLEDKALQDFTRAVISGSKYPEVYQGLGVIYGLRGEPEASLKYFNAALKLDPKNGDIYYNRAMTLGNMKRNAEAIEDYTRALEYSGGNPVRILTNRSNLLLEVGRFAEAIKDLDELIKYDSSNFLFYYNRAEARQRMNDYYGALADFENAARLKPDDGLTLARIIILKSYLKIK